MTLSNAELTDRIKAAPIFSALDAGAIRRLLDACVPRRHPAGAMIFSPVQKADRFFVVLAGRVRIFKLSARGDEQILHLYGQGETFGEAAMWADVHYPAHAQADTDALLLPVSKAVLREAIARSPDLAMAMMAGLSAKLREFNLLIEQLSLKEVPARLAGTLLRLADQRGAKTFRLPHSKRHLAAQIGTAPETLSRAFAKLEAAGFIRLDGPRVTIMDAASLRELEEAGAMPRPRP